MTEFDFTRDDVGFMRRSMTDPFLIRRDIPIWKKAFDYYNGVMLEKDPEVKPLSLKCRPCYGKVLQFIAEQERQQYLLTIKNKEDDRDQEVGG
jgi:hypothetical protein